MHRLFPSHQGRIARRAVLPLLAVLSLAACGGDSAAPVPPPAPPPPAPPPPPPPPTGITVVLDRAPIGSGGGEVRVTQEGAAFRGLVINLPQGAYSATTTWTVTERSQVQPALPAGVRQIGPALQIENGQGYSEEPFTLSVPVRVPADTSVALFYYEASTGTFELVPVLQRTDTSLVVYTRHVSTEALLIPGGAALRSGPSAVGPAGLATLLMLASARSSLQGNVQSGFQPGVDDWEFPNDGDYLNPGGYCSGSTLTAIYHYMMRKGTRGALFGLYDEIDNLVTDNPQGTRLASIFQDIGGRPFVDVKIQQLLQVLGRLNTTASGPAWIRVQTDALMLAIRMTGSPQLLAIYQPGMALGHAIVAHGIEWDGSLGTVFVADPNQPGIARQFHYTNFGTSGFFASPRAGIPAVNYPHLFVYGLTALMAMNSMAPQWAALEAETLGPGHYPASKRQYRDPADTVWRDVGPVVTTASPNLTFRVLCAGCPVFRTTAAKERTRLLSVLYSSAGVLLADDNLDAVDGADVSVNLGNTLLRLEERTLLPVSAVDYFWFNYGSFTVKRVPFEVSMSPVTPQPGQNVTYTVTNGGVGDATSRYRWTVGDQAPVITSFGTRDLVVPAPLASTYEVRVELIEPNGDRLADAKLYVGGLPFWRITTFFDQDELLDLNIQSDLGTLLLRILAAPQSGLIAIDDEPGGSILRLRVLQGGLWSLGNCCPPAAPVLPGEVQQSLGVMPEETFVVGPSFAGWNMNRWAQTTTDLGAGALTGQFVESLTVYVSEDHGVEVGPTAVLRITANRTGTTMTGLITITGWFTSTDANGDTFLDPNPATFRFPFTAVRLR